MHALSANNVSVKAGAKFLLQDVSLSVAPFLAGLALPA